jgi:hypothetical protein
MNLTPDAPATETFDATHVIVRGALLGALIVFAISFGASMLAGVKPIEAAGIALMPAIFTGPLAGGMIIVANYESFLKRTGGH